MTARETTPRPLSTTTDADAEEAFVESEEHDMLIAELDVKYYKSGGGVVDCSARMGSFCGRFLFQYLESSSDMAPDVKAMVDKELAWFQTRWAKRMRRLGEKIRKMKGLDETPGPAFVFTPDGVFFALGTGRGPVTGDATQAR